MKSLEMREIRIRLESPPDDMDDQGLNIRKDWLHIEIQWIDEENRDGSGNPIVSGGSFYLDRDSGEWFELSPGKVASFRFEGVEDVMTSLLLSSLASNVDAIVFYVATEE